MWIVRNEAFVYLAFILLAAGCAMSKGAQPESDEPVQVEQDVLEETPKEEARITPEMVEEYARIHQISDLKTAEFYLTHPDYAREHPYTPTEEDIAFYERAFLERMYPGFKKLAEKEGFMRARHIYMNNPPAGPGSRWIGSTRYGAIMRRLYSGGGRDASTGATNALLELDPVVLHYNEGMKFYKEGRLDDAIESMEKAVQAKPDAPSLLYNLGVMYIEKGNYARAVELLLSSIAYIKGTGFTKVNLAMYADVYMGATTNLGLLYTRIGMYNEAVEVLKEAIQFRPRDLDANYNLANVYYVMGDVEKASSQLRRFINLDPDNAEAHNLAGLIYYRRQLYNAAMDEFQIAEKLDPEEKQYSYNLGVVLAELGRQDEANQAFQRASGLEEGADMRRTFAEQTAANKVRELYNDGHVAMENRNWNQAIERFKAVLELEPDMAEAHINLGVSYRMKGDVQNQIRHFEEAARLKPDMTDVHYNLGLAYSDAGMYPRAIEELRKAVELNPSFKDAHFNLGMALYRTESYLGAAQQFEKSLELSPDWFEAHLNLGTCYLKIGKENDALAQFEKAVELKPDSAEAIYSMGAAYMNTGEYDEALELFQRALELDPGHRQARLMLKELEGFLGN